MPVDLRTTSNDEIVDVIDEALTKQLFEYNVPVTRANLTKALCDMFPNDQEFVVVCDETNNPPEVVAHNELRLDVYFKRYDDYYHLSRIINTDGIRNTVQLTTTEIKSETDI
jgi:hypothetical protein